MSNYPLIQPRRTRKYSWLRELVAETALSVNDLIMPLFVIEGNNISEPIKSMPNQYRWSIDLLVEEAKLLESLGIKAIALFPVINHKLKDLEASNAYNSDNLLCKAVREIKKHTSNIGIICDVALDPYTIHGHDGILIDNDVCNEKTIEILCKQSLVLAQAGCDIIAPSDMMDGRIGEIRKYLLSNNFNTPILSYAAKYASAFYGPFRDAVGSAKSLGKSNKKTYQMDYRNSKEAIREVELDINEGADIIMIKPALAYLDIIKTISSKYDIPLFAYQVSGEYSMMFAASLNGWIDFEQVMIESLIAIKRAGAKSILSYGTKYIAGIL